jgi:hypothetical protein
VTAYRPGGTRRHGALQRQGVAHLDLAARHQERARLDHPHPIGLAVAPNGAPGAEAGERPHPLGRWLAGPERRLAGAGALGARLAGRDVDDRAEGIAVALGAALLEVLLLLLQPIVVLALEVLDALGHDVEEDLARRRELALRAHRGAAKQRLAHEVEHARGCAGGQRSPASRRTGRASLRARVGVIIGWTSRALD